jgi:hypothetical protein
VYMHLFIRVRDTYLDTTDYIILTDMFLICVYAYEGEHSQDPREAVNLINGINFTRNDLHVWLAPQGCMTQNNGNQNNGNQNSGNENNGNQSIGNKDLIASVTLSFNKEIKISMIRIFNYNKSRTHCGRGVRTCLLRFDDTIIYRGIHFLFDFI